MTSEPRPHECPALNGATSQLDRWLAALGEGYAEVDGRSFEELCAFAPRLGELIWFYDLENRIDGDWAAFYAADATLALASLGELDLAAAEARFRAAATRATRGHGDEHRLRALRAAGATLVDAARQVDRWIDCFSRGPTGEASRRIRQRLERAVEEELAEPLATLAAYDLGAGSRDALGERLDLGLEAFGPAWRLADVPPDSTPYWGAERTEKIAHAAARLEPLAESLFGGFEELQRFAASELPGSLEVGDHRPQASLYLAFARLFRTAQESINTFGRRYIDFYYHQVLRERFRGALADRLYLTFALADDADTRLTTVPRGTLFPAGEGADGEEILYRSERDLVVTPARIERLRTLRLVRDEEGAPRRLLASEIVVGAAEGDTDAMGNTGEGAATKSAWPTFGPVEPGRSEVEITRPATLGLVLSSACLLLTGGARTIRLVVGYHLPRPLPPEELHDLLAEAFELSLTTADGWLEVGYGVEPPSETSFEIRVDLPPGAPPIAPLPAGEDEVSSPGEPPLPDVDPGVPALTLRLLQEPVAVGVDPVAPLEILVDPLSVLAGLEITSCDLRVGVVGLTGLQVENTDGEVDTSGTFLPFGGTPTVGSRLRIYHDELFAKRLESLDVALRWFGLPRDETGFSGYYQGYVVDAADEPLDPRIDNQSFQGRFGIVRPGLWTLPQPPFSPEPPPELLPAAVAPTAGLGLGTETESSDPVEPCAEIPLLRPYDPREVYLFRAREASAADCAEKAPPPCGRLCAGSPFDFPRLEGHDEPEYYEPSQSAIQLELVAPPYAFGSEIYTQNVLASVLQELARVDSRSRWEADCRLVCAKTCRDSDDPTCFETCVLDCLAKGPAVGQLTYPNEPWLPQAEGLEVGYTAHAGLEAEVDPVRAFHLLPFGGYRAVEDPAPFPLLPPIEAEGQLLIGCRGLGTRQTLTLLFELASLVAAGGELPAVTWSVLDPRQPGSLWNDLSAEGVRIDGTRGLANTGILELALPALRASGPLVEPPDLQWVRASVTEDASAFPDTYGITPHASTAAAVLDDQADLGHLAEPLPAHTITSAVESLAEIGTIDQPLPSFGGRPPETEHTFEVRVGERLRHKDRAILAWDDERLVLERFPTVWKVGVLPARDPLGRPAPGVVTVMVVPGPDGRQGVDPTAPLAPSDLLSEIGDYLAERASPFADIRVVNPSYVRLRVGAAVVFRDEDAGGAGIERLNDELVSYLSPWFYDAERATLGGHYVSESAIAEFIVTRPYVVWLETLEVRPDPPSGGNGSAPAWCFLTSAPSHDLREVDELDPCAPKYHPTI